MAARKLYRSKTDRQIGGVCGGLAEYFNQDSLLVRIVFLVLAFCGTAGCWAYVLLWLLVPEESTPEASV